MLLGVLCECVSGVGVVCCTSVGGIVGVYGKRRGSERGVVAVFAWYVSGC